MTRFRMKEDWDARARKDPLWYIACDDADNEAVFQASGRRDAAILLDGLDPLLPGHERVLEIGCGIGRLLEHMAPQFCELFGVDISGEMIRQGRERLAHLPKVMLVEIDGEGNLPFEDGMFDFCYSFITFHHIPEKRIVLRYIEETRRVLRPGGIFRFHLFARFEGAWQVIREQLTKKDTWRGCKFTVPEITSATQRAGFDVLEANLVDPFPGERRPFFGKNKPHAIWITARKPVSARG